MVTVKAASLPVFAILTLATLSTAGYSAGQQSAPSSTTGNAQHAGAITTEPLHSASPTEPRAAGTTVMGNPTSASPIKVQLVSDAKSDGTALLSVVKDVGPPVVSLVAVLVTLAALLNASATTKKALLQKDREDQRKEIRERLTTFFGPMQQLLAVSKRLTEAFKQGVTFSTLLQLLEGTKYTGNDAALLDEIIKVTCAIERLITTNSGLVADSALRERLSELAAHFRVLRLAKSGSLIGEPDRFKKLVFPQDLEAMIDKEIRSLNEQLTALAVIGADGAGLTSAGHAA